jgi:hypothetical protein
MATPFNRDVAVLAKKVYELSTLSPDALEARKWEALVLVSAAYGSATPEGIAKANADKEARWGDQIRAEGLLSALHPKWHLRTDDGKPPAAHAALVSALTNPNRDLRARLSALQFVAEDERAALDDVVRAFVADALKGAKGDARNDFVDVMRGRSPAWWKEPWLSVLPHDGNLPPVSMLIENQGATHDGGIYDDPADDTVLEGWRNSINTWDIDFLRDNPLAVLFTKVETIATTAVETAGVVASGANEAVKGLATILKWAPYVAAGVGVIVVTAVALGARGSRPPSVDA